MSIHMFGRAILDKLFESIFENFEMAQMKRVQFQNSQKSRDLAIDSEFLDKNCFAV